MQVDLGWEGETVRLRITDDGEGFVASEKLGAGFGLESMHERMARIGGHVNVESTPGEGTRVECFCPVQSTRDREEER